MYIRVFSSLTYVFLWVAISFVMILNLAETYSCFEFLRPRVDLRSRSRPSCYGKNRLF